MTQYEYIEELDLYLRKTYDVTLRLEANKNWSYGYRLIINEGGKSKFPQSSGAFNVNSLNWEQDLFERINSYLRRHKYIE